MLPLPGASGSCRGRASGAWEVRSWRPAAAVAVTAAPQPTADVTLQLQRAGLLISSMDARVSCRGARQKIQSGRGGPTSAALLAHSPLPACPPNGGMGITLHAQLAEGNSGSVKLAHSLDWLRLPAAQAESCVGYAPDRAHLPWHVNLCLSLSTQCKLTLRHEHASDGNWSAKARIHCQAATSHSLEGSIKRSATGGQVLCRVHAKKELKRMTLRLCCLLQPTHSA